MKIARRITLLALATAAGLSTGRRTALAADNSVTPAVVAYGETATFFIGRNASTAVCVYTVYADGASSGLPTYSLFWVNIGNNMGGITRSISCAFDLGTYAIRGNGQYGYWNNDNWGASLSVVQQTEGGFTINEIADQAYSGKISEPEIVVKDTLGNMVPDSDYSISFSGNEAVGTASVTVRSTGKHYSDAFAAEKAFRIVKGTPSRGDFDYEAGGKIYNGNPQGAMAKAASEGMGKVTIFYEGIDGTDYQKSIKAPVLAGTYAVTADVEEGENYLKKYGILLGSYEIAPKNVIATGITATKKYDGSNLFTSEEINADNAVLEGNVDGENLALDKTEAAGKLHSANAGSLGNLSLTGPFRLVGSASANYVLSDNTIVEASIAKADAPDILWPEATKLTYGSRLSESILAPGSNDCGSFAWTEGSIIPDAPGGYYSVSFTQTNSNYEDIAETVKDVCVAVDKAPTIANLTAGPSESAVYGDSVTLSLTIFGGFNPAGEVIFTDNGAVIGDPAALVGGTAEIEAMPYAESHIFAAAYSGDGNHEGSVASIYDYDIAKAEQNALAIAGVPESPSYGDGDFSLSITGGDGAGAVEFSSSDNSILAVLANGHASIAGAGTAVIAIEKAADANYNQASAALEVRVSPRDIGKADLSISESPVYTGSQLKPDFKVSDGNIEITEDDYAVEWGENISVASGGGITLAGRRNYKGRKTEDFEIFKAVPQKIIFPSASSVTYSPDQVLADIPLEGGSGNGSFAWSNGDEVPVAGNIGYNVAFFPYDAVNYDYSGVPLTSSISLIVNKAAPECSPPSGLIGKLGKPLSSVSLTLFKGFSWLNGSQMLDKAGNRYFTAVFTPIDEENYESVNLQASVAVTAVDVPSSAYVGDDGKIILPEGGEITMPGGPSFIVPDGATIHPETGAASIPNGGYVTIPGLDAVLGTPDDKTIYVPKGTRIDPKTGNLTYPSGTSIDSSGKAVNSSNDPTQTANEAPWTLSTPDPVPLSAVEEIWVNPFKDVSESAWYWKDVSWAVSSGLFAGVSKDMFAPQLPMTRGMAVTVLGRYANVDSSKYSSSRFSDVAADNYCMPFAAWAKSMGIAEGIGGGLFAPDSNITRQNLALLLYNFAGSLNIEIEKKSDPAYFSDDSDIDDYAREAVYAMRGIGVISGKPGNIADPKANAERAEVAAMLYRFSSKAKKA
ncbi:MAG: S-layer homology domain-containing protein [Clostridiales bacterium]|jgi:hypothetical protein|nr:S-layer homology domain-containing protein [Clostridiales bacterium]